MITTAIINFAYYVISSIISLFPVSTGFPSEVHSALAGLGGYLGIVSPLLPVATLLTCITLVFSVEISVFGFHTFKWIIGHVSQVVQFPVFVYQI